MSGTAAIEHSDAGTPILMQSALGLLSELSEEDVDWIFHIGFERHVTAAPSTCGRASPTPVSTSFSKVCLGSKLLPYRNQKLAD